MQDEKEVIDCPYCGGHMSLVINRWFVDREAMDRFGFYDWEEECCNCGHKDSHYE